MVRRQGRIQDPMDLAQSGRGKKNSKMVTQSDTIGGYLPKKILMRRTYDYHSVTLCLYSIAVEITVDSGVNNGINAFA